MLFFYICRSKHFFLPLCWGLISGNKTENAGEERGISARAFLASVSSALIVFRSQYRIFPTSGSQFFLLWQHLSWIILVWVLFFLEHPSKKVYPGGQASDFHSLSTFQASILVVSFAPLWAQLAHGRNGGWGQHLLSFLFPRPLWLWKEGREFHSFL